MRLYLAQHGQALSKEEHPDRPLSPAGQSDIQRLAAFLKAAGITVSQTLHSGKTRAQQTASILASAIMPQGASQAIMGLAPNDAVEPLLEQLKEWDSDTLVVGHLPYMAHLVSRLLDNERESAVASFEPGTLVGLERATSGEWQIILMLRPEHLQTQETTQ